MPYVWPPWIGKAVMGRILCSNVQRTFENDTSPQAYGTGSCLITFFFQPIIILCGFLLNVVCLHIFCCRIKTRSQRTRMVQYLMGLCLFDSMQLLFSMSVLILPQVVYYLRNQDYISLHTWLRLNSVSAYSVKFAMPLLLTFNYCSVWTITAIASERFRAICYPFRSTREKPYVAIATIFGVAMAINFVRYWEYRIIEFQWPIATDSDEMGQFTYVDATQLKSNPHYHLLMDKVLYALFVFILPFIILTFFNSRMLYTIAKSSRSRHSLLMSGSKRLAQERRTELRSALMIVCIVLMFFLCNTGGLIMRLVEPGKWIKNRELEHQFFGDMNNLLFNLNSLLNPSVYFLFTRNFRDLIHKGSTRATTARNTTVVMDRESSMMSVETNGLLSYSSIVNAKTRPLIGKISLEGSKKEPPYRRRRHRGGSMHGGLGLQVMPECRINRATHSSANIEDTIF